MVLSDVVIVLLAPLLAVVMLDESCLRYSLQLDEDLKALLDSWNIGQTGAHSSTCALRS